MTPGIRQGCPLASLLFIIVVKVLAVMIQGDVEMRGIPVPGERRRGQSGCIC